MVSRHGSLLKYALQCRSFDSGSLDVSPIPEDDADGLDWVNSLVKFSQFVLIEHSLRVVLWDLTKLKSILHPDLKSELCACIE